MTVIRVVLIAVMLGLAGCAGVSRNADCQFPLDQTAPTAVLDQGLLDREALLAEDLAIRFADRTAGSKSKWPQGRDGYRTVRENCMATLFDIVGRRHGVSAAQVREAATHRGVTFDGVVLLSFLTLYGLTTNSILRRILSGGLGQNALSATLAVAGASLAVAPIGALAWTVWAGIAETIRLGNGHASYRVARIPWRQHPVEVVSACLVLFWLVALYRSWAPKRSHMALRAGGS